MDALEINQKRNKIIDPFDKIINDLKRTILLISSINKDQFLNEEKKAINALKDLISILSNYEASFNTISIIRFQMNDEDYISFVNDLSANINQFKRIIRKIFSTMLNESNINYIHKNKAMQDIIDNKFVALINDDTIKKIISDDSKSKEIKEDIENLISYLNYIIVNNEKRKKTNDDVRIDIPLNDFDKKEENKSDLAEIDVEPFVNKPYEESRALEIDPKILELEKYLKKFDVLKERLKSKGKYNSLNVKEVKLYNMLESELLDLKEGKKRKKVNIKIKFYFKKLEKELNLNKDNYYKYLIKDSKKDKLR